MNRILQVWRGAGRRRPLVDAAYWDAWVDGYLARVDDERGRAKAVTGQSGSTPLDSGSEREGGSA